MNNKALSFLISFLSLMSFSAPFSMEIDVTNSVGKTFNIIQEGNDYRVSYKTKENYTLIQDSGLYYYATNSIDGSLVSSGVELGFENNITNDIKCGLVDKSESFSRKIKERYNVRNRFRRKNAINRSTLLGASYSDYSKYNGSVTGCVFLIDFPIFDDDGNIINTQANAYSRFSSIETIDKKMNGSSTNGTDIVDGYTLKQYFLFNSLNKFELNSYIIDYVLLDHPFEYYNDETKSVDTQVKILIPDVIDKLKEKPNYQSEILPKLRMLSRDGNYVRSTTFLYAGPSARTWSKGLWAHSWTIHFYTAQFSDENGENVRFFDYYLARIPTYTVGSMCHETAHMVLDYPDLYSYDSNGGYGVGNYCLMGYGNQKYPLVQICPYLKIKSGWLTPISLNDSDEPRFLKLPNDLQTVYKYANPSNPNEYYLIEHRGVIPEDISIPSNGTIIWRCREGYSNLHATYVGIGNDQYIRNNEVSVIDASGHFNLERGIDKGDNLQNFGVQEVEYSRGRFGFCDDQTPTAMFFGNVRSNIKLSNFNKISISSGLAYQPLMSCYFEKTDYEKLPEFMYTGNQVKPNIQITYKNNHLKEDIDFTVSYENNIYPGIAKAIVKGKGKYKINKEIRFRILKYKNLKTNSVLQLNLK